MDNLEEEDKNLKKIQPSKTELGRNVIENMNRPNTSNEIETVLKTPNKQKSRTRWLHRQILSNIYRRVNTYPSKTILKYCRGKYPPKLIP